MGSQSWLFYGGIVKLVCGLQAHRKWLYTGPAGQPSRFVRWYVRSVDAPKPETAMCVVHSVVAWVTGTKPPWTVEWEEAQAAELEEQEELRMELHASDHPSGCTRGPGDGGDAASEATDESTAALRRSKHALTAVGLGGIYVTWAVFAWCAPRKRKRTRNWRPRAWHALSDAPAAPASVDAPAFLRCERLTRPNRFIFTYGSLIYRLLGPEQQNSFARGWGVSYGIGAAAEWQDILKEAAKGLLVLAILERVHLTRPVHWLEARAARGRAVCRGEATCVR